MRKIKLYIYAIVLLLPLFTNGQTDLCGVKQQFEKVDSAFNDHIFKMLNNHTLKDTTSNIKAVKLTITEYIKWCETEGVRKEFVVEIHGKFDKNTRIDTIKTSRQGYVYVDNMVIIFKEIRIPIKPSFEGYFEWIENR